MQALRLGLFTALFSCVFAFAEPPTPTGLTAAPHPEPTPNIYLEWSVPAGTVTGYEIYRSTDGTNFSLFATLNSATPKHYNDWSGTIGVTYHYKVRSKGMMMMTSAFSNVASAKVPRPLCPLASGEALLSCVYQDHFGPGIGSCSGVTDPGVCNSKVDANGNRLCDWTIDQCKSFYRQTCETFVPPAGFDAINIQPREGYSSPFVPPQTNDYLLVSVDSRGKGRSETEIVDNLVKPTLNASPLTGTFIIDEKGRDTQINVTTLRTKLNTAVANYCANFACFRLLDGALRINQLGANMGAWYEFRFKSDANGNCSVYEETAILCDDPTFPGCTPAIEGQSAWCRGGGWQQWTCCSSTWISGGSCP